MVLRPSILVHGLMTAGHATPRGTAAMLPKRRRGTGFRCAARCCARRGPARRLRLRRIRARWFKRLHMASRPALRTDPFAIGATAFRPAAFCSQKQALPGGAMPGRFAEALSWRTAGPVKHAGPRAAVILAARGEGILPWRPRAPQASCLRHTRAGRGFDMGGGRAILAGRLARAVDRPQPHSMPRKAACFRKRTHGAPQGETFAASKSAWAGRPCHARARCPCHARPRRTCHA